MRTILFQGDSITDASRNKETSGAWEEFCREVSLRAQKAKEVAERYNLIFIPLQEKFCAAEKLCPADYWLRDGVHPTNMGHELIKREWLQAFKRKEENVL